jgi:zinc transport system substrate-binding protein
MRAVVVLTLCLLATACSGSESRSAPFVAASVYPLAWAAERVAPAAVEVVDLTPPGVEPHDVELTPADVDTIRDASLLVYLGGGFQPAVDDAAAGREGPSVDVSGDDADPHVWLDPVRFASVVRDVAQAVGPSASSDGAVRELERLDRDYRRGLADCTRRVIVTTHAAFGHLADRYGLTQVSLAAASPESEPGPRELEGLVDDVRASGATTVFTEPLASDRVARTVAREAGVRVAQLDPIEGLSEGRLGAGEDYLSVMRANLAAIREALGCR